MPNRFTTYLTEPTIDVIADLSELYEKHGEDLRKVQSEQRSLRAGSTGMRTQLDDIEAEITYLRIREHRPQSVVEVGCLHGWSTSWILRALRDNDFGSLHSFDLRDDAVERVPVELAEGRWTFVPGDVRSNLAALPTDIGYLFIDAAHSARFAHWYIPHLVRRVPAGTPVSVHDVFHRSRPSPLSEAAVILKWLRHNEIGYFTASRAKEPATFAYLNGLRADLGLSAPVHTGTHNPMIFFHTP